MGDGLVEVVAEALYREGAGSVWLEWYPWDGNGTLSDQTEGIERREGCMKRAGVALAAAEPFIQARVEAAVKAERERMAADLREWAESQDQWPDKLAWQTRLRAARTVSSGDTMSERWWFVERGRGHLHVWFRSFGVHVFWPPHGWGFQPDRDHGWREETP